MFALGCLGEKSDVVIHLSAVSVGHMRVHTWLPWWIDENPLLFGIRHYAGDADYPENGARRKEKEGEKYNDQAKRGYKCRLTPATGA